MALKPLIAFTVLMAALPGAAPAPDEVAVRAIEIRQRDAFVAGDASTLDQMWSPAYLVNSPGNVVAPRAEVLDRVRKGLIGYSTYDVRIEQVAISGDVAVVMGDERVTPKRGPAAGQVVNRRFTHVWQRQGQAWRALARHASVVAPPPSRQPATP